MSAANGADGSGSRCTIPLGNVSTTSSVKSNGLVAAAISATTSSTASVSDTLSRNGASAVTWAWTKSGSDET